MKRFAKMLYCGAKLLVTFLRYMTEKNVGNYWDWLLIKCRTSNPTECELGFLIYDALHRNDFHSVCNVYVEFRNSIDSFDRNGRLRNKIRSAAVSSMRKDVIGLLD